MANRRCPKLLDCQDLGPAPVLTGYAAEAREPLSRSASGPLNRAKVHPFNKEKAKKIGGYGPGAWCFTEHLSH